MEKIMKKSSVATKMILAIVFVTLVVASTTSFIILKQDYKKEMKGVEKVLDDVKSSFMGPLATALYSEDEEQASSALNGILKLPGLVEVRVILVDEEEPLHTLINPKFKNLNLEQRRSLGPSKKIDIIFKEEGEEPENVATMILYSTVEEAKKKIVSQIINFSIIQISQVIVLAIAIFLIFRNLVSKHLKSMSKFAQSMNLNDLSGPGLFLKRKRSTSNDELQDLTDSFNEMRNNLKSAHAELKDYAENLEDKVKAATQEIEEEKSKVSNLLNNMQQAVFLVDGNWNVIPPVSQFTSSVFGSDIVGKDIFSTVYKDLDLDSESYADIKSAFSLVYGDDLLQYQIVENNFLSRLNYRTKENEDKILSIKYTPLLNEDDFLETIMFVVDDITEKEKLENEINQKKKESEKNIQLITEMANAELEEIEIFLKNSQMLVQNVLKMAKTAPNDKTVIEEMFRFLHTLKGNSRVFNFNGISQLTHTAENQVMEIKTKIEDGRTMERGNYEIMIKELYGVSKEIMEVSGLAKKVFRIENKYEKFLLTSIFENIVKIDDLIGLHIIEKDHTLASNEGFKKRKLIFEDMKKNPPKKEYIEEILNNSHSIKASLKASPSFERLIENVSKFEESLKVFADYKNADINYFSEEFIENILEIKDSIKTFYLESDLNRPLTRFPQDWVDIIYDLYNMSSKINFENNSFDKSVYRDLDNINNTINHHHLTLLKYLVNISSDIMKKDNWIIQHKKELQSILADFWEYILVVIKIDSLNISKIEDFDNLKQKTEDIITLSKEENNQSNVENLLKELDKKYLITVLFKKLTSTGIGINSFLDEVHQKINYDGRINKDINPSDFFLIKEENRSILKIVKNDLKTSRIISDLPSKTKKLASEGSSFSKALDHYFTHNKRLTFIKLIDFYQLLEGFTAMDAKEVGLKKAETWPVIVKNLKKLEHLIQGKASIHDIGEAFKRLKDIPVVPNLTKFKTMVNDIAIKLSKSVNFTVLGGDISMDKDSYNLLQDGIVHILRNCLDHGIELPEERTKLGKKGKGNIEIYCNENEDGMLEMIVKDDGKGINPEIISKKAVEKGIYTEEGVKNLKEDEILDIIFSPHFSQKEEVDELSGRGVGMDVVKKNLEKMDGCIKVESKLGHGTKMTLTLNPGPPKF